MKEIKFRAWVPRLKKYYFWGVGDIEDNGSYYVGPPSEKECIHQQFTGLLDKNEKEIYEGDILKHEKQTLIVSWGEDIACFECRTQNGSRSLYGYHKERVEIIGNIFQHHELLEGKE